MPARTRQDPTDVLLTIDRDRLPVKYQATYDDLLVDQGSIMGRYGMLKAGSAMPMSSALPTICAVVFNAPPRSRSRGAGAPLPALAAPPFFTISGRAANRLFGADRGRLRPEGRMAREITIAYIGGGSRDWAPKLMSDLALCDELSGELRLFDIDLEAARANTEVAAAIFGHADSRTRFEARAVASAEAALRGADFVVLSIEPGPITMRYADLEIPARYGILQPVGDTTGPGGILRALRAVPVYHEYGQLIAAVCPRAWVINYTNPMTVCTAALHAAAPGIRAFGCCHEVLGTQARLARWASEWFGVPAPARESIELDIIGVNHCTFATSAGWEGRDLLARLREAIREEGFFDDRSRAARSRRDEQKWFDNDGLIACDFLRHFGVLGAAGDRHLAEFVPWYLAAGEEGLHRWGVVLTPYAWRVERMGRRSARSAGAPLAPSGEEGVRQMLALLGLGSFVTNVNVPNRGQAPGLPEGAVVETYALLRRDELTPIASRPLPQPLRGMVAGIAEVQGLTLRAALERDADLAFQALLGDPLVRIPTDRAWKMFREMLDHARPALPGF